MTQAAKTTETDTEKLTPEQRQQVFHILLTYMLVWKFIF